MEPTYAQLTENALIGKHNSSVVGGKLDMFSNVQLQGLGATRMFTNSTVNQSFSFSGTSLTNTGAR